MLTCDRDKPCQVKLIPPAQAPAATRSVSYLFSYFVGNGEDGLHLAWSEDGYRWKTLNQGRSYLQPRVGESKLMRDPCLLRGPDGRFHMVWTTSWGGQICYRDHHYGAVRSQDLVNWEDVTKQLSMPKGLRHGTAIAVEPEIVERLRNAGSR
jgi:Arabinosidase BT_3657-like, N-terminal